MADNNGQKSGTNGKKKNSVWTGIWVGLLILFFFPAGIIVMWVKKVYSLAVRIIITALFTIGLVGAVASTSNTPSTSAETTESKIEEATEEDVPEIELTTDEEKAIWEVVHANGATLKYCSSDANYDENTKYVSVEFECENNEELVNTIVSGIKDLGFDKLVEIIVKDVDDDSTESNLAIIDIKSDGTIDMVYENPKYNTARNKQINDLFSAWDGSCPVLTQEIKKKLNDEDSFKHIQTTYIDVKTQDTADKYTKIFQDAGYDITVNIGNLVITTQFSAKNAFNATIKATAYGVADLDDNIVTLVTIE